jgi:hypothetical protein
VKLTIAYITSRREPHIEWFFDSLRNQTNDKIDGIPIIIVDTFQGELRNLNSEQVKHVKPKPTIWQGEHRITKQDWWAKSNALNTAICLCQTEFIACVDDRCVLGDNWINSARRGMETGKAVCGAYEKRVGLEVAGGVITNPGQVSGVDPRLRKPPYAMIFGNDWFGCSNVVPLEWCLKVNGYPEDYCDGMRYEDTTFGWLLTNNGLPLAYDRKMMVIQDRTQGQIGPDMRGEDFGVSPNDKSHALLKVFDRAKTSLNSFDIRALRNSVQAGNPFPPPTASQVDWYSKLPIKDFS